MDETDLISGLQSHLARNVPVPVRTSGMEDERPVPVIVIDDWDTTEMNFHNSAFSGEVYGDFDNDGTGEYERYLTFDYRTRVEFTARHSDEVEASRLKDKITNELRLLRENPQSFDTGLKQCRLGGSGNPTFEYTEPKEAELMVSARFYGDHTITLTPSDLENDVLETVQDTFTFNP
jgi:hypothetical protein